MEKVCQESMLHGLLWITVTPQISTEDSARSLSMDVAPQLSEAPALGSRRLSEIPSSWLCKRRSTVSLACPAGARWIEKRHPRESTLRCLVRYRESEATRDPGLNSMIRGRQ